jgi:tRNA1(Val) A37 N6-methylase TrmN6
MLIGLDRLWPEGPLYRQFEGVFPLSSDTAWLGAFVRLGRVKTVCDLGCGGGALSLQLLGRKPALRVSALDILPEAAEAAKYNLALNGFAPDVRCGDLRDWRNFFDPGSFDLVVSNPPYWDKSAPAAGGSRGTARQEKSTLPELCQAASGLLRQRGKLCLVYPPKRLGELICALSAEGLEPKRLRLVHKDAFTAPCALLMESVKGGGKGMEILPPLLSGEEFAE